MTNVIDSLVFENYNLHLAIETSTNLNNLLQQIKIAAPSDIEVVINSALPSCTLLLNKNLSKKNVNYFCIKPHGKYWERIKTQKKLALFIPNDFLNTQIEIFAIKSKTTHDGVDL